MALRCQQQLSVLLSVDSNTCGGRSVDFVSDNISYQSKPALT